MRSTTVLFALLSIAVACPVPRPQSDSGYSDGQLIEPPNNTPYPGASQSTVSNPSGGGNDGGYVGNGDRVNDNSQNTPVTNPPQQPVDPVNGGNDGGYDNGVPVDPKAPASGSSTIGIAKKAATGASSSGGSGITITKDNILAVSQDAASCPGSGDYADECRTADQAAGPISDSFSKFGINNKTEAAAVLSLMMYECGNFKYNIHHFPGPNPGQGTRNMMNFQFILEYAKDVLSDSSLPASADGVDNGTKDQILSKVLGDEYSFGSGAWFYSKKCTPEVKKAVQSGSQDGWSQYITTCVGGTIDDGRKDAWNKAMKALGA